MQALHRTATIIALAGAAIAQELGPAAEPRLSFDEANELARALRWLSLRGGQFDTRGNGPDLPDDLRAPEAVDGGRTVFLVQFDGPVTRELKLRVAATGVELLDYVPNHSFMARGDTEQRAQLERMLETVWSGELHPAYRIDPRLRAASVAPGFADSVLELAVLGFLRGGRDELERALREVSATVDDLWLEHEHWVARVRASAPQARQLARRAAVQWIEPASAPELRNNNAVWVVQTNQSGYTRIWDAGLHGEGQVIGHIDGPFTTNPCWFRDPNNAPVGPAHRKVVYLSATGADDHGTHTACTAAGDAQPITGSTSGRGLAYMAKLAHTDFPVATFSPVATTHSQNGARIHTNSWGDDTTTAYNLLCNSIDAYQHANEDELVFFAISNTLALTNPDSAKNMVAVGATQNGLAADGQCFGAVGPTFDGRRKPDLMAPGCNVTSATTGSCAVTTLNGTSMAAPALAAAGALVRQYFEQGFHPSGTASASNAFTPSGALVKAVLANSAQDVTGIPGFPSDREGWGRVNLDRALYFVGDAAKLFALEQRNAAGLTTGQQVEFTLHVQSPTRFDVALVFTDAAGTVNAADPVVNDLDLELVSPSNVTYFGNVFSAGASVPGGVHDAKNNVERCSLSSAEVGAWTVRVLAPNVPQGPQGFGLCANGDIAVGGTSSPDVYCTSSLTTNFCVPAMTTAGVARASAASGFVLAAASVEGQRQGLIFYGTSGRLALPWRPGSTSFQCVRQPLQRMDVQSSGGVAGGCAGLLATDWNAFIATHPAALGAPVAPGLVVDAQAWFRDPGAPGLSNLSNAVEFTVQP
jgi:hypothetical protein